MAKTQRPSKFLINNFVEYVMSFYGPQQIYGDFFQNNLKREEVVAATENRLKMSHPPFDGDSADREIVRDIIFRVRGKKDVEHAHLLGE